jgi:hypothetical protein
MIENLTVTQLLAVFVGLYLLAAGIVRRQGPWD